MQNTDEQIRKMLELKETIIEKMSKYQDEIDFLQKNLEVLDVVLKGSSFTKASALVKNITKEEELTFPEFLPDQYFSAPSKKDVDEFVSRGGKLF